MKKYFLLAAALLFIFSACSSDDDETPETEPSILETWTLVKVEPAMMDMSCPNKPTITFDEDGTTTWTIYDPDNECASETSTGTWVNTTGSIYTVTVPGYGDVTGTVNFTSETGFTFKTTVPDIPVEVTLTFSR